MNIVIIRAFVRLREIFATHKDLSHAIEEIRRRQDEQGEQITSIIETINQLLLPEPVANPSGASGSTDGKSSWKLRTWPAPEAADKKAAAKKAAPANGVLVSIMDAARDTRLEVETGQSNFVFTPAQAPLGTPLPELEGGRCFPRPTV